MKLKTFNKLNSKSYQKSTIGIRFTHKTGTITLNQVTADLLDVKEGSKIAFHFDEDSKKDWYLEVGNENGIELRVKEHKGTNSKTFMLSSRHIVLSVLESIQFDFTENPSQLFKIAKEPLDHEGVELWPILTAIS